MLLPCPSCKKPVFVSGATLSAGAANVQCSNCGASLTIHPDGSSELHAPAAPPEPEGDESAEANEANTQWREPASLEAPKPLEMPIQPATDHRVESLSTVASKRTEKRDLGEPPSDWPIAPAADVPAPPSQPPPIPTIPPAPPAISGGSEQPSFMVNAATIHVETLEHLIPEAVFSTVETTDPRWHREDNPRERDTQKIDRVSDEEALKSVSTSPEPGTDTTADRPGASEPPPLLPKVPSAFAVAEPPAGSPAQMGAPPFGNERPGKAPAFSATPATANLAQSARSPIVTAPSVEVDAPVANTSETESESEFAAQTEPALAEPASFSFEPPSLGDENEEELDEFARSRRSPYRALLIAAALIVVIGAAWSLFTDDGDVNAGEPLATRTPSPQPSQGSLPPELGPSSGVDRERTASGNAEVAPESSEASGLGKRPSTRVADLRPKRTVPPERQTTASSNPVPSAPAPPNPAPAISKPPSPPKTNGSTRDRARAEQLYVQANRYLQERKYQLAITSLKQCIRLDPRHGGAYRSLGVSYMTLGQERAAIEAYKKFVQILPAHKDATAVRQIIADYR